MSASYNISSEDVLDGRHIELHSLEVVSEGYVSRVFHRQLGKYVDVSALLESRREVENAACNAMRGVRGGLKKTP